MPTFRLGAMAFAIASIYSLSCAAAESAPPATSNSTPIANSTAGAAVTDNPIVSDLIAQTDGNATAQSATPAAKPAAAPAAQVLTPAQVTAKKLDEARDRISPETGSSTYRFSEKDIDHLPLGSDTPLNQILLQAPGVVQDSYGQLHVRGDHDNLQYRINGVIIPEPITGFGQSIDPHFASQISLLTGALPAQYGYRTAGVIDISTKGSDFQNGGSATTLFGSNGLREGSLEYAGTAGNWNYFYSGSDLRDDLGIENPTSTRDALHDTTTQSHQFAYLSNEIDSSSSISLMVGTSRNKFEIPDVPGQTPNFALAGPPVVSSSQLNARQDETNQYEVLAYQASPTDNIDYQVALFHRYTDVHYQPDPTGGDLAYLGVAAQILRKNEASGVQADGSLKLNDANTLRAGLFAERERFGADNQSQVFLANDAGMQTSDQPISINDQTHLSGGTYGVYLQNEWQPLKALTINYGARYDKTDTVTDAQQLSPRAGVTYDLSQDTRLHAGYARYFTPPPTELIGATSIERFAGTTGAVASDADTAVQAERSNYYDIGVSEVLTPSITVGLDTYYRQVTDLQDEGQFGNALIYSAFNYARGKVKGVELSSNYKQGSLSAYANLSVSQAEGQDIVTGQYNFNAAELAYISNHWVHLDHDQTVSASAGSAYTFGDKTVGADMIFGSGLRSGFANTEHLPSYTTVNLSADQHFNTAFIGKFDVRLAFINIFDRVYELRDGTGIGVGAPQFGARRGVFLALTKAL
jgi:outer membrane receptor protein involved in Fe transport